MALQSWDHWTLALYSSSSVFGRSKTNAAWTGAGMVAAAPRTEVSGEIIMKVICATAWQPV